MIFEKKWDSKGFQGVSHDSLSKVKMISFNQLTEIMPLSSRFPTSQENYLPNKIFFSI